MAKIYCKSSYLLRKDSAENWQNKNPILRKGEQGLETDTGIIKIGDGATAYNSLSDENIYFPKSYASNNFANALKGNVTGQAVRMDDISPNEHTLRVKVSIPHTSDLTSVTVTRCGKNLIQFPYIPLTAEKTVAGITYTPLSDGGIKLNGTATALSSVVFYNNASQGAVPITLKANLTYMASTGLSSNIGVYIRPFKQSGNSHVAITDVFTTRTITLTEDALIDQILVVVASGTMVNNVVVYPQIELGPTATGYEPYDGQTYTPAADGTVSGVKSLYPTTTLMTNTEGAIIEAEYNRDINKAFAELQQAILSMGGNT